MTYQKKNLENSWSVKIHIGKGPIYQGLSGKYTESHMTFKVLSAPY